MQQQQQPAEEDYGDDSDEDEVKERQHFAAIVRAFDHYKPWALAKVDKLEVDYQRLGAREQQLVNTAGKIDRMRKAINANAELLQRVVKPHRKHVGEEEEAQLDAQAAQCARSGQLVSQRHRARSYVPETDMEKLQSTIKQFVREWGNDGKPEREAAHTPLLEALQSAMGPDAARRGARVLVPGAGLGRLAWEVARLGYRVQASEFSYFMLIAGNYVLNGLQQSAASGGAQTFDVHPWVLQTCNVRSLADQLRAEAVPDVAPWSLPPEAQLSMCAGDFLEVYKDQRCAGPARAATWEAARAAKGSAVGLVSAARGSLGS